jgi:anti-sigma-K factor RskA
METGENAEYLLDYGSGKLNAEMRAQIELHMESCHACREFAGGQQAVLQTLDAWEPAAISMDFDRRLYRRIEQDVSWWTRLTRPLHPLFRHAVPIGAAAGVVVMAGLLLLRPANEPAPPMQKSAEVLEALQPEQVEAALEDMETLREFSHVVQPDNAEPKM